MYCRNYNGTINLVLCREVYYTVSLIVWESPLSEIPLYLLFSVSVDTDSVTENTIINSGCALVINA